MNTDRRTMLICATFSALGLSLNLLWCTLMGHTPGFLLSSLSLGEMVNARTFWLLGILLISILFVALPRQISERDRSLAYVMPVLSAVGTACFALSFNQSFFDPTVLATTGLTVAGLGYFWFVSRYVALLAKTQGFSVVVWCIVAAFPLRQLASLGLDSFLDPSQQVMVAIALPFLSALFLGFARITARKASQGEESEFDATDASAPQPTAEALGRPKTLRHAQGANDMVIVLVIAGVLLAMVRIFGPSGAWGDSNTTYFDSLGRIPAISVLTICLALFALLTLLLMVRKPVSIRFQLPILVVIAGLFVVVIRSQLGDSSSAVLLDSIVQANDPFAHLLFWSVIAAALTALDMPENRIIGIPGLVYAASSIVWVVFLRGSAVIETAVILVVVAIVMNRSWFSGLLKGRDGAADVESADEPEDSASRLAQTITERCQEVASEHGLSPREAEVFLLLAQGRTCSFIQDELVLAESTVKTHMSHIYAKMDVSGRQGMMDLVFGESAREKP
ncbi:helix-turn-helix transcriptional regulator [Raoultibacter timonensis]|uniref:helix-turn-helix transcriptional regulator n=1 Tax=Raoultibacter timonensis TaxID=1907662 RepID=UPI000C867B9A|nr:LuxR C-terminal-related transcriptional regulator [Raoultibacter timonensis]